MIRLAIVLLTALLAALGLIVGVVVALGVAWIAVALPVLLLLGLAAGLVAVRRRLWPRADDPPLDAAPWLSSSALQPMAQPKVLKSSPHVAQTLTPP
jgi:hypothetical protein